MLEMNLNAQKIIDACEEAFGENCDACNEFTKTVAAKFGITLTQNADAIVAAMHSGVAAKQKPMKAGRW
jgi:hypothetical protein